MRLNWWFSREWTSFEKKKWRAKWTSYLFNEVDRVFIKPGSLWRAKWTSYPFNEGQNLFFN